MPSRTITKDPSKCTLSVRAVAYILSLTIVIPSKLEHVAASCWLNAWPDHPYSTLPMRFIHRFTCHNHPDLGRTQSIRYIGGQHPSQYIHAFDIHLSLFVPNMDLSATFISGLGKDPGIICYRAVGKIPIRSNLETGGNTQLYKWFSERRISILVFRAGITEPRVQVDDRVLSAVLLSDDMSLDDYIRPKHESAHEGWTDCNFLRIVSLFENALGCWKDTWTDVLNQLDRCVQVDVSIYASL